MRAVAAGILWKIRDDFDYENASFNKLNIN